MREIGAADQTVGQGVGWITVALRLEELDLYLHPSPAIYLGALRHVTYEITPTRGENAMKNPRRECVRSHEEEIEVRNVTSLDQGQRIRSQKGRVHIYQGRGLPAADDNGRSDPYVKIIYPCKHDARVVESHAPHETLNPLWDTTLPLEYVRCPD
eukprot:gene27534-27524_t